MAKRARNSLVLVKEQSAEGVEATLDPATDAVAAFGLGRNLNPDIIQDNEFSSGLGAGEPVVGAFRPAVNVQANMRGSGAAGTAPRVSPIIRAAGLVQATVAALPSSSVTDCTGGTTTTVTFDRTAGNGTQWPGTNGALNGHPIVLSGNPTTPTLEMIRNYTISGNIVTITLSKPQPATLSSSTKIVRPAHIGWTPGAPDPHPCLTVAKYRDGQLEKFMDARPNMRMNWRAGGKGTWDYQINGIYLGRTDPGMPAGVVFDSPTPPVWKGGICSLEGAELAVSELSLDLGNTGQFPDDANATSGTQSYLIGGRVVTGSFNPLLTLVSVRDLPSILSGQVTTTLCAVLGQRLSGTAGTRFGTFVPGVRLTNADESEDGVVLREVTQFQAKGSAAEFYFWQA